MKKIKSLITIALLVAGGSVMGQEIPEPVFEKDGELIKGTFYYEDGNIKQEGTYKDGKLHGEWISYNPQGEKEAIAEYTYGKKTGKWFFWSNDRLTEVNYNDNRIAKVNSWKSEGILVDND
ncbi:toxin-antitoxin system YwqK family antitoxin [Salegentibacter sp.]|uniref:toxin-antitoxin system YwqK family antitoxin n=1 Tax=Salegentibacter sp. TaxID=1903072 RepID=UPI00356AB30E